MLRKCLFFFEYFSGVIQLTVKNIQYVILKWKRIQKAGAMYVN
ncbi:hypothetical protein KIS1582_2180 [Cytobacillus firmus]|uniref:Uncharacterized protein n=1 Tax=Cytobacillus firmus TaxID=1399 RepID=A0A800MXH6_CYTFI|nr:hypothetical protein KIS1582_2180 [Cytobacillus firmus]